MINFKLYRGIILTPLLIFIALVSMIAGTVAVLNRGAPIFSTDEQRAQLNAAVITKQVSELKEAYRNGVASGWDASKIKLDESSTGLYNPAYNFAQKPTIPASACASQNCTWEIIAKLKANDVLPGGIGGSNESASVKNGSQYWYFAVAQTGATADVMFVVKGLTPGTAEQLNKSIDPSFATDGKGTAVPATTAIFEVDPIIAYKYEHTSAGVGCKDKFWDSPEEIAACVLNEQLTSMRNLDSYYKQGRPSDITASQTCQPMVITSTSYYGNDAFQAGHLLCVLTTNKDTYPPTQMDYQFLRIHPRYFQN